MAWITKNNHLHIFNDLPTQQQFEGEKNGCIFFFTWQRGRLENQIRQHEKKKAALSTNGDKKEGIENEDDSYDVTLDEDFLTALEYGMPPASGMVHNLFACLCLVNFFPSF